MASKKEKKLERRSAKALAAHNGDERLERQHEELEERRVDGGFETDQLKDEFESRHVHGREWRALVKKFKSLELRCKGGFQFHSKTGEGPTCGNDVTIAKRALAVMAPLVADVTSFLDERQKKVPSVLQRQVLSAAVLTMPFRTCMASHYAFANFGPAESQSESWAKVIEYATALVKVTDVTALHRFVNQAVKEAAVDLTPAMKLFHDEMIHAYGMRGEAFFFFGDYDAALVDARAALAEIRLSGSSEYEALARKNTEVAVVALALMKRGTPRPHFEKDEREKLEREFGLGAYAPECRICAACGQGPSDSVKLSKCARCERAWYCSRDCQKVDYKTGGHKRRCPSKFTARCSLLDESYEKGPLEADLATQGYRMLSRSGVGLGGDPIVVFRDRDRRLYEALSDQPVCYLGDFKKKHGLPIFDSGLGNCTETGHDFCRSDAAPEIPELPGCAQS